MGDTSGRDRPFRVRLTRGTRIYAATPRLRGLLALNMAAAAAGAFVLVNTVVIVRDRFGGSEADVALAFGAFGAGSMLAALALPAVLDRVRDRRVMVPAGLALGALTLLLGATGGSSGYSSRMNLLGLWLLIGLLYSAILTPSGRLLRRSAHAPDRPAVFAAQFALSHFCWLIAYPLAGWVGRWWSLDGALSILGFLAFLSALAATRLWRADEPSEIEHDHPDLAPDHPHMRAHRLASGRHQHAFVIDDEHRVWPSHG